MFGVSPVEIVVIIMSLLIYAGVLVGIGMALYFIVRKAVRDEIHVAMSASDKQTDKSREVF